MIVTGVIVGSAASVMPYAAVLSAATTTVGAPIRSIVRRRFVRPASRAGNTTSPRTRTPTMRYQTTASQVMPSQASQRVFAGSMTPPWIAKAASAASHPRTKTTAEAS